MMLDLPFIPEIALFQCIFFAIYFLDCLCYLDGNFIYSTHRHETVGWYSLQPLHKLFLNMVIVDIVVGHPKFLQIVVQIWYSMVLLLSSLWHIQITLRHVHIVSSFHYLEPTQVTFPRKWRKHRNQFLNCWRRQSVLCSLSPADFSNSAYHVHGES